MIATAIDILGPTTLASAPPALPGPPAIQHWLFERPVLAGLALLAFAAASFLILNRRGDAKRGLLVGGALLALAIAVAVAGFVVETTHERLIRLSNEFVDAVAAGQIDEAGSMLADDLVVAAGPTTLPGGRRFADRALEAFRSNVRVTEHFVTDESASAGDPATSGVSQFLVRATTDLGFAAAWIRLSWREDASGDWQVYLIEVLRIDGREPDGSGGLGVLGR